MGRVINSSMSSMTDAIDSGSHLHKSGLMSVLIRESVLLQDVRVREIRRFKIDHFFQR
jgi:hypothetical protein